MLSVVNLCHRQQHNLHVTLCEKNDIVTNFHCVPMLHKNAALKRKKVLLPMAFYRRAIWLTGRNDVYVFA